LAGGMEEGHVVASDDQPAALGADEAVEIVGAMDLKRALDDGRTTVIDVGGSQAYRAGHIPLARWSPRARLEQAIAGVPRGHNLVITADHDVLAELAARDLEGLRPAPVAILEGGTDAWRRAGYPVETSSDRPADADCIDHWFWEHARRRFVPQNMQEYLDWEIALPGQITADGDARFRVARP
ncbi:MAG: sulfurtransferase, partial [Alphaproteobacteria bacterium]|nr:sulfurtransferase [Alphaproteobacteria bacterium]